MACQTVKTHLDIPEGARHTTIVLRFRMYYSVLSVLGFTGETRFQVLVERFTLCMAFSLYNARVACKAARRGFNGWLRKDSPSGFVRYR